MKTRYMVGVGGSADWEECADFAEARDACLDIALEMAFDAGIEADAIDTWGEDNPDVGAGACPDGDEGGYWPVVRWEKV